MSNIISLHVKISPDLDKRFRDKVIEKFGYKKGNITKAMNEALEMWIAK